MGGTPKNPRVIKIARVKDSGQFRSFSRPSFFIFFCRKNDKIKFSSNGCNAYNSTRTNTRTTWFDYTTDDVLCGILFRGRKFHGMKPGDVKILNIDIELEDA